MDSYLYLSILVFKSKWDVNAYILIYDLYLSILVFK